jgi:Ca-activated chloride channel family protein
MKALLALGLATAAAVGMAGAAVAKSAEDYYHGAAYKYIAERHQEASAEVEEGLRAHPDDARLQNLASLLREMKDQQRQDQNQSGEGGQNQPQPEEQRPDSQNKGEGEKDAQDREKEDPGQNPEQEEKPQDSQTPDRPDSARAESGDSAAEPPPRPGQMSREEAERLLNSFADEEQKEQRERRMPRGRRPAVETDW